LVSEVLAGPPGVPSRVTLEKNGPTPIAFRTGVNMNPKFTGRIREHHHRLGGKGMFDTADCLAVDVIIPIRFDVPLNSGKILEGLNELGGVRNVISVERHKAHEVLNLLDCCGVS